MEQDASAALADVEVTVRLRKIDLTNAVAASVTGKHVKLLQTLLNASGAGPTLTIDGKAGDKTKLALKNFQSTHGLTQDNVVGKDTWTKLIAG